jgi:hypothetical protein
MNEQIYADLMQRFDQLAVRLVEVSKEYGPEVVDAALWIARIEAASVLMEGLVWAGTVALCVWLIRFILRKSRNPKWGDDEDFILRHEPWVVAVSAPICGVGAGVIGAIVNLSNLWAWVGVIEPKLWIAKRLLESVV